MNRLLCRGCGAEYKAGTHIVYEATAVEPAEFARAVYGVAKAPTQEQRTITTHYTDGTQEASALDTAFYNCDLCSALVKPGDPAVCVSIWMEIDEEPPAWEHEYVEETRSED